MQKDTWAVSDLSSWDEVESGVPSPHEALLGLQPGVACKMLDPRIGLCHLILRMLSKNERVLELRPKLRQK